MLVKGFFGFVRNILAKKYFTKVIGGMRNQLILPLRLELFHKYFRLRFLKFNHDFIWRNDQHFKSCIEFYIMSLINNRL